MSKNIKRIVAMVVAIGTVFSIAPAANFNFLTERAYAEDNTDDELDSLELFTESNSRIRLYESYDYDSDSRIDSDEVEPRRTYYAKTTSNIIHLDVDGIDSDYIRVFKGSGDTIRGKKISSSINISEDLKAASTTLYIKIYGEDLGDDTVRNTTYDNEDYDLLSTYKIKIKYTPPVTEQALELSEENLSQGYDNIYLSRISINGSNIPMYESKTNYTYNLNENTQTAIIKATPEDSNYTVKINGVEVRSKDSFKTNVTLNKGTNIVKIEIKDDSDYRLYNLIVNRGTPTSSSISNTYSNIKNKWIKVDGLWQYNNSAGNTVLNTWIDNYYLKENGNMATGWLMIKGNWYYFADDGAKRTGWQRIKGPWYYFNTEGKMVTGWVRDARDGKWYYLYGDGAMAYSTTIDGYKLGRTGAWIG